YLTMFFILSVCVIFYNTIFSIFFFQAEDGIRDRNVTGVQTCALPIYLSIKRSTENGKLISSYKKESINRKQNELFTVFLYNLIRSEERRVGKECRYRWES